jgi:acyl-CoA reductase-like NAD-dependent aldehyde dehydrogenase/uncharacterized protein (DUF2141 family)
MSLTSAAERMQKARGGQQVWAAMKPRDRVHTLTRFRRQIAAQRQSLVDAIIADTGKPALDALAGDVLVTLEQMRFYERRALKLLAPRHIRGDRLFYAGCRFTEHYEPYGTVLVLGPSNYPLQLSLVPAVTAIYAGNAVVLKVSERTPRVARAIEDLVSASALPRNVLQVICACPEEGRKLIEAEPDFVFFTGSSANGRVVAACAGERGIPTQLELGGKDPAIVFADCDMERTVEGIVYGAFSNAGQVCVGVKRLYVEQAIYDRFLAALVRRTAALRVGSGNEGDLGMLPEATLATLHAQVQDALRLGAKLESPDSHDGRPVILSNVPNDAMLLREESFGPILSVQPFVTETDALALANASRFALGASVWTRDSRRAQRVAQALDGGTCAINDVIRNIAHPAAAFGGNAASGYGRYHGVHGLHAFSRIKSVMENRSPRRHQINWFPLTCKTYRALDRLIELRHRPRGWASALRRLAHLVVLASMLAPALALYAQAPGHLLLRVLLPAGAHGQLAYLVFRSSDGFPQDHNKAVLHGFSGFPEHGKEATIDVGTLPPGRYAVSVYLDVNGNQKLDSGLLGIPREPVGVSNNPKRRMGPPLFKDSAFGMGPKTQTVTIKLVRP